VSAVSGSEKASALQRGGRMPLALPRQLLRLRSDASLAERYIAGDESAFDVIYERHRPVVLAVCMGVLGTAHDAEDAAQETFSSLANELRSSPPAELRAWLIRVARNASIDLTRRRKHRLLTFDGELPEIPARPHSGSAELENVISGIRELPENQRTALLMREMGGHSYNEIAETLETDEESVRGLIARARSGMRSYREATELPCAVARIEIETVPDARRYDKTVRRHLKVCKPCSNYRAQLRDDANPVRSALPTEAGAVIGGGLTGGGLSAGAFTAAKTGLAISQLAATCAASVCAVGAVGGLVILHPDTHMFGLTGVHLRGDRHIAKRAPQTHHKRTSSNHTASGYHAPTQAQGLNSLSVPVVSSHPQRVDRIAYGAAATDDLHLFSGSQHARSGERGDGRHRELARIKGGAGAYGWGNYSHKHLDRSRWHDHSSGFGHPGASGSHSGGGSGLTSGGSTHTGSGSGSTNPYGGGSGSGRPSTTGTNPGGYGSSGGYGGSSGYGSSGYGGSGYGSPSTYYGPSQHGSRTYSGPSADGGSNTSGDPGASGETTYSGPTMSGGSSASAGSSSYGASSTGTGATAPAGSGTPTGSTTSTAGSTGTTGSTTTAGTGSPGSTTSGGSTTSTGSTPAAGSSPTTGSTTTAGSTTAPGSTAAPASTTAPGSTTAAGSTAPSSPGTANPVSSGAKAASRP
jgi:RNA polymerase sigma factor (sigma-70 family)